MIVILKTLLVGLLLSGALSLSACSRSSSPQFDGDFSVMTYNLGRYGLMDRDGDGQPNNPKPESEVQAIHTMLADVRPDILAVQEIGNPLIFADFQDALRRLELNYPYIEYLGRDGSECNIAVLSRYPIVSRQSRTEDEYRIDENTLRMRRGIIDVDIQVSTDLTVRIIALHLKSKEYHRLGQTEMRRNEARIVAQHIRRQIRQDPSIKLLVLGTLSDQIKSAPVRDVIGSDAFALVDIHPTDSYGAGWTRSFPEQDNYQRIDYMLASPELYDRLIPERTRIIHLRSTREASLHRPLISTFGK